MSWEIFRKDEVNCPCGKGQISTTLDNVTERGVVCEFFQIKVKTF